MLFLKAPPVSVKVLVSSVDHDAEGFHVDVTALSAGYSGDWCWYLYKCHEGFLWCRGWDTDEAKAFCVAAALAPAA